MKTTKLKWDKGLIHINNAIDYSIITHRLVTPLYIKQITANTNTNRKGWNGIENIIIIDNKTENWTNLPFCHLFTGPHTLHHKPQLSSPDPPSCHRSTRPYTWQKSPNHLPLTLPLVVAPLPLIPCCFSSYFV